MNLKSIMCRGGNLSVVGSMTVRMEYRAPYGCQHLGHKDFHDARPSLFDVGGLRMPNPIFPRLQATTATIAVTINGAGNPQAAYNVDGIGFCGEMAGQLGCLPEIHVQFLETACARRGKATEFCVLKWCRKRNAKRPDLGKVSKNAVGATFDAATALPIINTSSPEFIVR
ncbi:hypothetical protein [Thalassoroseus pseudoceratinae]|uniref:hypothetical protein n=1 Tax=Thalassoroseus pseudoceratinae TaxID=2713176 RepID=UPI0014206093|nr:hypothetical protein [Thalassoroseus pseudoceratinae]